MDQESYYGAEKAGVGRIASGPMPFPLMGDSFRSRLELVREKKSRLMDDMVRLTGDELALAHILSQA